MGLRRAQATSSRPVDATLDCPTMSVGKGVLVEELLAAAATAKRTVVILDACRDQPLGKYCPLLPSGKTLSFKKIEPGEMRNLLLGDIDPIRPAGAGWGAGPACAVRGRAVRRT